VQSNGDREFNEVFFTDATTPLDHVVGAPGDGWTIAMTTVAYERGPTDVGFSSRYARVVADLERDAAGLDLDPGLRLDLARAHVQTAVLRAHVLRGLSARTGDAAPGPEGSIDKLLSTRTEQILHHATMDLHAAGALQGAQPGVVAEYLYSRAASIAGGTSEIQRTIVAERLLGLPRG
jgi:alkylation response protein AidB-like acyl-CoA dehydrogenase